MKAKELEQFLSEHRGERHIVILQDFPDPDAISSAFAHQLISAPFDIAVDIVYERRISHAQNIALVRLLDLELIRYGFQAFAYIRGNDLLMELSPHRDRFTIRLQKSPAVHTVGDVYLKGLLLAGIESAFQVRQDKVYYITAAQHCRGPSRVRTSPAGFRNPLLQLDYHLCPWPHLQMCLRSVI